MQSMLLMSVSRSHSVNCRINEFKCSHCKLICLRFRFLHASHSKNSETFFFKSFLGERYEWRARKCFLYTIFIHISLGIRDTSFALSFTPHSMSIMNNKISSNKTHKIFSCSIISSTLTLLLLSLALFYVINVTCDLFTRIVVIFFLLMAHKLPEESFWPTLWLSRFCGFNGQISNEILWN